MLVIGIILIILGIIGRVFASVTHITDSTAKAMGWTFLNRLVALLSWLFLTVGIILIIGSLLDNV